MPLTKTEAKELLRSHDLRATGPRLTVLRIVEGAERPLAHSEITDRLGDGDSDPATIYRNLVRLTEVGLVRIVSHAGGMARYEFAAERHPHFVCDDCGTVSCLPASAAPAPAMTGPWASSLADADVQLQGHCPDCLAG